MYGSHLAVRGDERQLVVVGAKGPSHRSIPLSSDLHVYPAHRGGLRHLVLPNPAGLHMHRVTSPAGRMFMFSRIVLG